MTNISNEMKSPIEESDLQKILNIKNIPKPLKGNVIYGGSNLDDFFIGYRRIPIGADKSNYKIITNSVVLKNKGINLPVKRNSKLELPWLVDDWNTIPDKIVIVLEVSEEYFMLEDKTSTTSLLLGVFDKEDLHKHLYEIENKENRGEHQC